MMRRRPEAVIEAEVLRAVGRAPDTLLLKNEVGQYFAGAALYAVQDALRPFGTEVVRTAVTALARHRVVCGLGVGSPDLVGAVVGRAGGLELKAADGVVSDAQSTWHRAARARGVFVAVVRGVDEARAAIARWRAGGVE